MCLFVVVVVVIWEIMLVVVKVNTKRIILHGDQTLMMLLSSCLLAPIPFLDSFGW